MTKPKHPTVLKGPHSTLLEEDVRRIRVMAADGTQSVREMAEFYRVSAETIRRVIRRETWNRLLQAQRLDPAELEKAAAESAARMRQAITERRLLGPSLLKELEGPEPGAEK